MENQIIDNNNNINKDLYKTNKSFSDELKRCSLILDIYKKDNEEKVLVDKKEYELLKNNNEEYKKLKEQIDSQKK